MQLYISPRSKQVLKIEDHYTATTQVTHSAQCESSAESVLQRITIPSITVQSFDWVSHLQLLNISSLLYV